MSFGACPFFDGDCREAFELCRDVFGGDFLVLQTYRDGPPDMDVPESEKGRIMHVSLPIGPSMLMGGDCCPAFAPPPVVGSNFAVSVVGESREHCDEVFARLSRGGEVRMPMQETFRGAWFGHWTDRFGVPWMIAHELSR